MKYFRLLLVCCLTFLVLLYILQAKDIINKKVSSAANSSASILDSTLADGFDFPVGNKDGKGSYTCLSNGAVYDSWYVATKMGEEYSLGIHTGEDWNGSGGGNTDLGQPVYSSARGKVIFAGECPSPWGNVVLIEHQYIENTEVKTVYSQYAHLKEIFVRKGDNISRRQKIASVGQGNKNEYPAHLHFEIRKESMRDLPVDFWPSSNGKSVSWVKENYESPSAFILRNRKLPVPCKEKVFVHVKKSEYKLFLYKNGILKKTYEIALGQQPVGRKEKRGDLKVPEGIYTICEKTKGPFDASVNWANEYLGVRWLRISYPNQYDAEYGLKQKLIGKSEFDKIIAASRQQSIPPQGTALGGGIGIHGWTQSDWSNDGNRGLTWGCISMHNEDLKEFYDLTDLNTAIMISR
jgi:murein DD-endopeptidase MepM/ murein hydrolase activator NlpD